jgi:integrase
MSVRRFRDKWIADIHRDGQRHRKVFDNRKQAEAWEGKIKAAALEGRLFDVKREAFDSFSEMLEWFLRLPEVKRKRSYAKDVQRSAHLEAYFGAMTPSRITPETIERYIDRRLNTVNYRGRTNKPDTVNLEIALLKSVFNKACRNGKTRSNPTLAVKKLRSAARRDRVLTDEEWAAYYEASSDWYKPIALCAYTTGMRRMEILRLRWNRVDLRAGFIRLRPEDTKTNEGRPIPIDPRLDEVLRALTVPVRDDVLVFTRNGQPIPDIRYGHQEACEKAGIRDFRFHDFRHCAITNWRRKGIDFLTIMKASGHRSLAMFQRYNTVTEADLRALVGQRRI